MEALMKRKVIWGLVFVFLILPIGLGIIGALLPGSNSSTQAVLECSEAVSQDLLSIESGSKESAFKISNGKFVLIGNELLDSIQEISPNASQEKVIAGYINDSSEVGIWTIGLSGSPISAINTNALNYSVWGSAANPGSRAAEIRDLVDASMEAKTVSECVTK
jgi:hypothetical protein